MPLPDQTSEYARSRSNEGRFRGRHRQHGTTATRVESDSVPPEGGYCGYPVDGTWCGFPLFTGSPPHPLPHHRDPEGRAIVCPYVGRVGSSSRPYMARTHPPTRPWGKDRWVTLRLPLPSVVAKSCHCRVFHHVPGDVCGPLCHRASSPVGQTWDLLLMSK